MPFFIYCYHEYNRYHEVFTRTTLTFVSLYSFLLSQNRMCIMDVINGLDKIRSTCAIRDDQYWDIVVAVQKHGTELDAEGFRMGKDGKSVLVATKDGFTIEMIFVQSCFGSYWNGYTTIPARYPFVGDTVASEEYDELQYKLGIHHVELTYKHHTTIGWDHAH